MTVEGRQLQKNLLKLSVPMRPMRSPHDITGMRRTRSKVTSLQRTRKDQYTRVSTLVTHDIDVPLRREIDDGWDRQPLILPQIERRAMKMDSEECCLGARGRILTGEEVSRYATTRPNVILEMKWKMESGCVFDPGEVVVSGASIRQLSPWRLGNASGGWRAASQPGAMVMPLGSRLGNSELGKGQPSTGSRLLASPFDL